MNQTTATCRLIVDTAIELAEASNWEAVRLQDVADSMGITLDAIRELFSEKDELVDAWFDRADSAMLQDAALPEHTGLPRRQRMHRAMMIWFDALSGHRRVTRQMILGKLEPGHVHIQIPALMRISRTVQWLREAAGYNAVFPGRAMEETIHTGIYLAAFSYWMFDESPQSGQTGQFLDRQLQRAERIFPLPGGGKRREDDTVKHEPPSVDPRVPEPGMPLQ